MCVCVSVCVYVCVSLCVCMCVCSKPKDVVANYQEHPLFFDSQNCHLNDTALGC